MIKEEFLRFKKEIVEEANLKQAIYILFWSIFRKEKLVFLLKEMEKGKTFQSSFNIAKEGSYKYGK